MELILADLFEESVVNQVYERLKDKGEKNE